MSVGFGGYADLVLDDERLVEYSYCSYNVNNEGYEHFMRTEDGEILLDSDVFGFREKKKGKLKKRFVRDIPIQELIDTGMIIVKNASGTWRTTESDVDFIAMKLISNLLYEVDRTGKLPEHVSLFY